jgi:hypothetical protein
MQDEAAVFADPNDRASQESNMALELRNRDRERKLIEKIDETIARTARRSTSCASARSRSKVSGNRSKVSGNRSKVSGNSKEALNGRPREGGDQSIPVEVLKRDPRLRGNGCLFLIPKSGSDPDSSRRRT